MLLPRRGVTGLTETDHFFGTALVFEEINAANGVRRGSLKALHVDPAGNSPVCRALARRRLADGGVVFSCSLSATREAATPLVERHGGLLWYPSIYDELGQSESVLCTGATPSQTVLPPADHLLRRHGPRVMLVGSHDI